MVVRAEPLRERIALLREALARLQALRATPADVAREWAIERGLQIACEAVFDIGNHILAAAFGARAQDYADVTVLLTRHGVLDDELERRLRGLAGFRNLLVHDYARIDPSRVLQVLDDHLPDLARYADATERWLDAQPRP